MKYRLKQKITAEENSIRLGFITVDNLLSDSNIQVFIKLCDELMSFKTYEELTQLLDKKIDLLKFFTFFKKMCLLDVQVLINDQPVIISTCNEDFYNLIKNYSSKTLQEVDFVFDNQECVTFENSWYCLQNTNNDKVSFKDISLIQDKAFKTFLNYINFKSSKFKNIRDFTDKFIVAKLHGLYAHFESDILTYGIENKFKRNLSNIKSLSSIDNSYRKSSYSKTVELTKEIVVGLLRESTLTDDNKSFSYPSSGAVYDTEFYFLSNSVLDLDKGFYRFNRENGELEDIETSQDDLNRLVNALFLSCPKIQQSPQGVIFLTSNYEYLQQRYQNINYKLALLNAGVAIENLHISACSKNISNYINGHFFENSTLSKYILESEIPIVDLVFP